MKRYVNTYKYKQSSRVPFFPVSLHDNDYNICKMGKNNACYTQWL